MRAFTPGPWRMMPEEVGRPYIRIRGTIPGRRYKIANVLAPADDDRYSVPDTELEEIRANARLIAVAPELYFAAEKALHYMRLHKYADQVWADDLEAAIVKARGEA